MELPDCADEVKQGALSHSFSSSCRLRQGHEAGSRGSPLTSPAGGCVMRRAEPKRRKPALPQEALCQLWKAYAQTVTPEK